MLEETKNYFMMLPVQVEAFYRHKWAWYGLNPLDKLFLIVFFKSVYKYWDKECRIDEESEHG